MKVRQLLLTIGAMFSLLSCLKAQTNLEGSYTVTGYFFHPTAPRVLSNTKTILKVSANKYQVYLADLGPSGYSFQFDVAANGSLINWHAVGSTPQEPSSGFMTIDKAIAISGGYTSAVYNNSYDTATHTFYMHYGYGIGSSGPTGYNREIYEKYVFKVFNAPPEITSFTPTTGSTFTKVIIKGKYFSNVDPIYNISFGGTISDSASIISDSVIYAWVGDGQSGDVSVHNTYGAGTLSGFIFNPVPAIADSQWSYLGNPGFGHCYVGLVSIAITKGNIPFIAFTDSLNYLKVLKYDGIDWITVGTGISSAKVNSVKIVLDKANNPIVSYMENSNYKLSVKKFNGTTWEYLGSSGIISPQGSNYSLVIDSSDFPYILYSDTSTVVTPHSFSMIKYDGTQWIQIGVPNFAVSVQNISSLAIDKSTNTPYVLYDEYSPNNNISEASCKKFDGVNWVYVGNPLFTSTIYGIGFSSIKIDNLGNPIVSCQDDDGFERQSVYKFSGGIWNVVGNKNFSKCHTTSSSLAIDKNNKPYVSFIDYSNNRRGTVMSLNNNTIWDTVGARGFFNVLYSASYISENALAIDTSNTPIITFIDRDNGKISVMRYNNTPNNTISGKLITPINKAIRNATIAIAGIVNNTYLSDALGNYSFNVSNGNYTIKPKKNNDIVKNNGISTIDIILTQKHILNQIPFNSPYKIIAADVNNDKKVSAIDIIFMKRLILGVDTTFTGNRLWAFVDSAYSFPNPANPFPYKDSISYTGLSANKTNQTFIGVKLGDVDYSWNPAVAKQAKAGNVPVELYYDIIDSKQADFSPPQADRNDDMIRIPIRVKNFKELLGLQYTLNFNSEVYEYVGIENNLLKMDFNDKPSAINDGHISFLWADANSNYKTLEDGTVLFELVLKAKSETLNPRLEISSDITSIEAIDKDLIRHDIILTKDKGQKTKDLYSIYPNPAKGFVNINVAAKNTRLIITDLQGRVLKTQTLVIGNNEINIASLKAGVYLVELVGLEGTTIERLVVE